MDNLLCDEAWLSEPLSPEPLPCIHDNYVAEIFPTIDAATVDEAIFMDLEKESCFSNHGDKCVEFFVSKKLIDSRFHAVQWLIQTRSRLNLSFETVFSAASCFDRFVYVTSCNEWTNWMVELVAVTSLSIAAKFNEVMSPSLQELQMEGLNHMFHHKTVLEMELIMLKALEWRVNSVTRYYFSQIFASKLGLVGEDLMISRIINHLLDDLCDLKMLQYPPSVVAAAAIWNVLEEKVVRADHNLGRIMSLFGQEHKEKLVKCVEEMKLRKSDHGLPRRKTGEVKSIVSGLQRVELMERNGNNHVEDLSAIFQILRSDKKRDRANPQDNIRPAKRMTIVLLN